MRQSAPFPGVRAVLLLAALAASGACSGVDDGATNVEPGAQPFSNQPINGASNGAGGSSAVSGPNGQNSTTVGSVCISGQARCHGGRTLETCNGTGSGFTATSCEGSQVCLAGACRQPSCSAGETLCLGNEIHTCNSDGKSTTLSRTCDTGSACDPGMLSCRATLCEPLVGACNGSMATRCDGTGFAFNASANTACGAGQRCELGLCLNPEQVAPSGQVPITPITPGPGQVTPTPGPGAMQGAQAPAQVCTPSAVTCDGANTISTCGTDGLAETITRCADGTLCSGAGACNAVSCNPQGLTTFNGGQATVYWFAQGTTNNGNVACNFGIQPGNPGNGQGDSVPGIADPQMFIAMNTTNFRSAASCGACVEMNYQGRKVTATVVDECPIGSNPTCTAGHLDLSRGAWNALTNNAGGTEISGINWNFVPCNTTGKVTIELKEPTNEYWNQFLVRGHRYPITKAEVQLASGAWVEARRQSYNYFEPPDGVMGNYRVRVTDVNGAMIEEQLELASGAQGGNAQFACQ